MTLCTCGKPAETFGGMCDRCASLQMLGLGTHARQDEIESAYLTLVKVWHPDRFAHDPVLRLEAEEKLKEINAAHDFLSSEASALARSGEDPTPKRSPNPRPFEVEDAEAEPSDEVEKILKRQHRSAVPRIMLKVGFAIGAVALMALIWFTADAILSSSETTQRWWDQTKSDLARELHANKERLAPDSDKQQAPSDAVASAPTAADPATATASPAAPSAQTTPAASGSAARAQAHPVAGAAHIDATHLKGAQPYVTSGLTPMEVLSALGKPTSSNGEKMMYGASEIDFKNGQVSGWKIDPGSPIRVKLWPEAAPAPGMTTFGAGSTKSDVIALQGTPNFFSDSEFGYGSSRVFFQNNRVVSWKDDPASVRLRVPR